MGCGPVTEPNRLVDVCECVLTPRIEMRLSNARLLSFLLGATLLIAACTPPSKVVSKYKYLIKETDAEDHAATKTDTDNREMIKEKAPAMNVGERLVPVLQEASDYVGTPYKYGGKTKSGIDCSGLTQNCYAKAGVDLPRSAADQSAYGELVERKDVQIGDLVFFDAKNTGKIDHVGMVTKVEGDKVVFIHSSTSKGVRFDYLNEGYWVDKLKVARRVPLK